jgi:hypothetical protein
LRPDRNARSTSGPPLGFAQTNDALALLAWLHKDALIAKLGSEIDHEADDKSAMTLEQRQKAEAEVLSDLAAVEYEESAAVWAGLEKELPCQHRADGAPQAILQVQVVTAPRTNSSPGTSPIHVWDILGGRRR